MQQQSAVQGGVQDMTAPAPTSIAATKAVAELKAKGMQVNELSAAELNRMRLAVKPIYDKFTAEYDPALVRTFRSELERIQK
jgi:TRAP-type transport system periplasmic protein